MDEDLELRKTIEAMNLLDTWVTDLLIGLDAEVSDRFNNALLNIVVQRLIEEEGQDRVATILFRLAEAVASGEEHYSSDPVELTKLDG